MVDYADLFGGRFSTTLLADAAYRRGIDLGLPLPGLAPLDVKSKLAGPAVTVTANSDLVSVLEALHRAGAGEVVVIANQVVPASLMGDLIGAEAVRKGLAGFVVDGLVRDTLELVALGLPVFCRGSYPVGPLKVSPELKGIGVVGGEVAIGEAAVSPGMWMFGDADGLIILRAEDLAEVFEAAEAAARREQALADEIASGTDLAAAFRLDDFLAKRARDPQADFNAHLTEIDRAI